MRKLLLLAAVAGTVGVSAGEARAQVSFGAHASFGDDTDLGIGGRVYAALPFQRTRFVGSFDYFFPDDGGAGAIGGESDVTYFEVNANAIYSLPVRNMPSFAPYVGGGLNIARASVELEIAGEERSNSDTDMGLNLLGGAEFGSAGNIRPFVELRIEMAGGDQFVLAGGVRF
ncbi:MAG TPA: hypothetical protein VF158_02660 [Longimicrobiales bacterium]